MNVNDIIWTPEPWLPYLATDYIRQIGPRHVFEWGTGGSTIFFKEIGAHVVSVESNEEWAAKIQQELQARLLYHDIDYNVIPYELGDIGPDYSDPTHYKSYNTEYPPANFKKYVDFIDDKGLFDLILIDGYARASCIVHAVKHVKLGGWLVIDNTDRDWYLKKTVRLFDGWERVDFYGYGPILAHEWQTTFFRNASKEYYTRTNLTHRAQRATAIMWILKGAL